MSFIDDTRKTIRGVFGGSSSNPTPHVPGVPSVSTSVSQIPSMTGGGSLMSTAGIIGATLNGVANIGNMINGFITDKRNYDMEQAKYKTELEQYEYEKALQERIFDREDNAIQRQVADLKKAGLSPVLASGSGAGSGAVVAVSAPGSAPYRHQTQLPALGNDIYDLVSATQLRQNYELNELQLMNSGLQNELLLEKLNQAREITTKLGLQNNLLGKDVDWYVPTKVFRGIGRLGSVVGSAKRIFAR